MCVLKGLDNVTRKGTKAFILPVKSADSTAGGSPSGLASPHATGASSPAPHHNALAILPLTAAVQAVFQHSCAQWVWMSDADAFIMTLQRNIYGLASNPQQHHNPKQACNSDTPDVILAGACLAKVNTGSVLWRNTGAAGRRVWGRGELAGQSGWKCARQCWSTAGVLAHHLCLFLMFWFNQICF